MTPQAKALLGANVDAVMRKAAGILDVTACCADHVISIRED
jgi:hypothetical protein